MRCLLTIKRLKALIASCMYLSLDYKTTILFSQKYENVYKLIKFMLIKALCVL